MAVESDFPCRSESEFSRLPRRRRAVRHLERRYHPILRDLTSDTNTIVSNAAGNVGNSVGPNRDVAFWGTDDYQIYRWRNGTTTQLTNDSNKHGYPVTDGTNVVYTTMNGGGLGIFGSNGQVILTQSFETEQLPPWSTYLVRAGWAAYVGVLGEALEVFTYDPSGATHVLTQFGGDGGLGGGPPGFIDLDNMDSSGGVMFVTGSRRYFASPSAPPVEVSGPNGRAIFIGNSWYLMLGCSLFSTGAGGLPDGGGYGAMDGGDAGIDGIGASFDDATIADAGTQIPTEGSLPSSDAVATNGDSGTSPSDDAAATNHDSGATAREDASGGAGNARSGAAAGSGGCAVGAMGANDASPWVWGLAGMFGAMIVRVQPRTRRRLTAPPGHSNRPDAPTDPDVQISRRRVSAASVCSAVPTRPGCDRERLSAHRVVVLGRGARVLDPDLELVGAVGQAGGVPREAVARGPRPARQSTRLRVTRPSTHIAGSGTSSWSRSASPACRPAAGSPASASALRPCTSAALPR